jgi:hypothetical protein
MKAVWKYVLRVDTRRPVVVIDRETANPIHVGVDPASGAPAIWVEVDTSEPEGSPFKHRFELFATGEPITVSGPHVGSVILTDLGLVFHVYRS